VELQLCVSPLRQPCQCHPAASVGSNIHSHPFWRHITNAILEADQLLYWMEGHETWLAALGSDMEKKRVPWFPTSAELQALRYMEPGNPFFSQNCQGAPR
jgi:hypothetical protein